jgi:hypothetical protein
MIKLGKEKGKRKKTISDMMPFYREQGTRIHQKLDQTSGADEPPHQ